MWLLVNFVSRRAVFYGRMCSGMGQNVQFYCECFGTTLRDAVTVAKARRTSKIKLKTCMQ